MKRKEIYSRLELVNLTKKLILSTVSHNQFGLVRVRFN
jgi:hypothetical protein